MDVDAQESVRFFGHVIQPPLMERELVHSKYNPVRMPKIGALAVAVAALMAAGSAMAAEQLYGGGATFPAPAYVGTTYQDTNPDSRLSTNAGNHLLPGQTPPWQSVGTLPVTSFFQDYTSDTTNSISYCQTGSGFGKTALGGAIANQVCRDFSTTPLGFTTPAGINQPDFIGTDSPLSSADYTNLMTGTNAARSPIVQIPTLAGAIALPHNASVNGVVNVDLSVEMVCKIYAGVIDDWSLVTTLPSPPATPAGSGPIHVAYRQDTSGTTFAFTSYLAARCNNQFGIPANFFKPNQSFTAALLPATPAGIYAASSANQGNNGVVTAVVATNNAVGYADFGEVQSQGADYARVTGFDPAAFGTAGPISISAVNRGRVLDGAVINLPPAAPVVPTATKNCMLLINPATTIPGRYPIAAFTYINSYHSGNGTAAHVTAIRNLQAAFYKASRPALPAGFAYLDGNLVFRNLMNNIIAGTGGEPGCVF